MIMVLEYWDRDRRTGKVEIPFDPLADAGRIKIPAQPDEGLPAIDIEFNSDAIWIHSDGKSLGGLNFSDLVAEAKNEGG